MNSEPVIRAVDDDPRFLDALHRSLRVMGLTVTAYPSPTAFLDDFDAEQPGCLLSDLRMPDMDGLELQQVMAERRLSLPIIFITAHGDTSSAVAACTSGAADFLEKPVRQQRLLDSVRRALETDAQQRQLHRDQAVVRERYAALSPREQQVFALIVSDRPNKEIARELRISPRTVEHHREHLMLKMQAHSLPELVTMSMLCGVRDLHL